jgi:predicted nucleic acid-binding protein
MRNEACCALLLPSNWIQAAEVLGALKKREHYDTAKIRDLAFDVLIALSARSIGATLITCNETDFQIIRRHLAFSLVCWK